MTCQQEHRFPSLHAMFILATITTTIAVECMKNEAVGRRGDNVYRCDDPAKPRCCEDGESRAFTCCEDRLTQTKREQIILWCFFAFIFVLFLVACYCLKKDMACCEHKTLRESMQDSVCCRKLRKTSDILPNAPSLKRSKGKHQKGSNFEFIRLSRASSSSSVDNPPENGRHVAESTVF